MAINESIKERLADSEVDVSEVILIDDEAFNKSLIGTTVSGYLCAVYEYNTMVSEYAEFHKISQEEAADYICYNIIRSLPYYGEKAPVIVDLFTE